MNELSNDLKNMYEFDKLKLVNKSNLPILIKWFANEPSNLPICLQLNKHLFWMDRDVMLYALHFGINKRKKFIKYLKKNKEEKWVDEYVKERFGWSDKELAYNKEIVDNLLKDKSFLTELDNMFGFDKKQCNEMEIEYREPEFRKEKSNR